MEEKKMKKYCFVLVLSFIVSLMSTVCFVSAAVAGSITADFDTTGITSVGQIITATVSVSEITNLAGYQVNLVYDPAILQPVKVSSQGEVSAYGVSTVPDDGILLKNANFTPFAIASNDLNKGVLNFGKAYLGLDTYRKSGIAEKSGSVAVVKFKVLQVNSTKIAFAKTPTMPVADNGVSLFDWDSKEVSGYTVIQPGQLATSTAIMYGDVDGSNMVDVIDYSLMKQYLLTKITDFPSPNGKLAADVDGDGQITVLDFSLIKKYLLGVINKFPAQK
jgi:hypothetical protein